jgi:MFS transporter, DHA1 family, tetracycline resistance protein
LIGAPLLAVVSRMPPADWRIGATFYVSAALQVVALLVARRHFAARRMVAVT